jgi:hypothetical protein
MKSLCLHGDLRTNHNFSLTSIVLTQRTTRFPSVTVTDACIWALLCTYLVLVLAPWGASRLHQIYQATWDSVVSIALTTSRRTATSVVCHCPHVPPSALPRPTHFLSNRVTCPVQTVQNTRPGSCVHPLATGEQAEERVMIPAVTGGVSCTRGMPYMTRYSQSYSLA